MNKEQQECNIETLKEMYARGEISLFEFECRVKEELEYPHRSTEAVAVKWVSNIAHIYHVMGEES